MEADEYTENLMRNLYNIEINKQYKTDMSEFEKLTLHYHNERACSGQHDTSELQLENIFVCTSDKPCTNKTYENELNVCNHYKNYSKAIVDFYTK